MKTKQQYFYNALLMTAVTLLMRTVSVSFNVYVSGKVGAEAMGLLSLISSVYNFAVTLATSGIHLATVRTMAEHLRKSGGADNRRCLLSCLSYAAFFGALSSLLLFSMAGPIGKFLLRDLRSIRAMRMLAVTLLPIALTSVLNGYFTAVRRAFKNAIASLAEQAVKITLTGYLLVVVAPRTVEGSVLAILMGGAVSECLTLFLNILLYFFDRRHFSGIPQAKSGTPIKVASVALPVAISTYVRSGLVTVEHILIPIGLAAYGAVGKEGLAAYGALSGMALPVVLYPTALLTSFTSLLIPEITEQATVCNQREIRYIAGRVYQMTLLFSVGIAGIMLFLSGELGEVLYENEEVSHFIKCLAPLVPIMYLDSATDAMLKGLGEQVYSMNINIIDALISVISVAILVPFIGIDGYLCTIYITEILNAAFSICRLLKISGYRPSPIKLLFRPLIAIVGATAFSHFLFDYIAPQFFGGGISLTIHILIVSLLYVAFLLSVGGISRRDLGWFFSLFGVSFNRNGNYGHKIARTAAKTCKK